MEVNDSTFREIHRKKKTPFKQPVTHPFSCRSGPCHGGELVYGGIFFRVPSLKTSEHFWKYYGSVVQNFFACSSQ
jgi:hypothetical protein